jgi:hypothetical protein
MKNEPTVEFDYNEVEENPADELRAKQLAADAIKYIADWLAGTMDCRGDGIALRAHVFVWFVAPYAFGNRNQAQMAEMLGVSPKAFSKAVTSLAETFNMKIPNTKSEELRGKHSEQKKEQHAARKATELQP